MGRAGAGSSAPEGAAGAASSPGAKPAPPQKRASKTHNAAGFLVASTAPFINLCLTRGSHRPAAWSPQRVLRNFQVSPHTAVKMSATFRRNVQK